MNVGINILCTYNIISYPSKNLVMLSELHTYVLNHTIIVAHHSFLVPPSIHSWKSTEFEHIYTELITMLYMV